MAAAGFAEVYAPVKPYLDDLDVFLQSQVAELEPEIQEHVRYVFGHRKQAGGKASQTLTE